MRDSAAKSKKGFKRPSSPTGQLGTTHDTLDAALGVHREQLVPEAAAQGARFAILSVPDTSGAGDRFFLREFFVFREDDQCTTPE